MASTGIPPKPATLSNPAIHSSTNGKANGNGTVSANLAQTLRRRVDAAPPAQTSDEGPARLAGYGLPCAKCHLYYSANLEACPICHSRERVSAIASADRRMPAQSSPAVAPDAAAIEQQREEFLRQFKSQLAEIEAETAADGVLCALKECQGGEAGAEVCKACYERQQERIDVYEAALHMDLKEAAQIVYNAVWADPSDPAKTYENAAAALLAELRKRTGTAPVFSQFHPLSH